MPHCKKCGQDHFNFAACPKPQQAARIETRHDPTLTLPDGYHGLTSFGKPWGNAPTGAPVFYQHVPRVRQGSLVGPDGEPYEPPPLD